MQLRAPKTVLRGERGLQRLLVFLRDIGFAEQPQRETADLARKLGMLNDKRVELSGKIFTRYEIAEKMELPLGTVKSRIFFARQRLQEMLKDYK